MWVRKDLTSAPHGLARLGRETAKTTIVVRPAASEQSGGVLPARHAAAHGYHEGGRFRRAEQPARRGGQSDSRAERSTSPIRGSGSSAIRQGELRGISAR